MGRKTVAHTTGDLRDSDSAASNYKLQKGSGADGGTVEVTCDAKNGRLETVCALVNGHMEHKSSSDSDNERSTACALATSLIRANGGEGGNLLSFAELVPATTLVQQHVRLLLARPISHAAMMRYLTEKGPQPYRCPYAVDSIRLLARLCGVSEAEVHRQLQPPLMRLLVQRLYVVYHSMEGACPHSDSTNFVVQSGEKENEHQLWQGVVLSRMQASMTELYHIRRQKQWESPELRQDAMFATVPEAPWRRK